MTAKVVSAAGSRVVEAAAASDVEDGADVVKVVEACTNCLIVDVRVAVDDVDFDVELVVEVEVSELVVVLCGVELSCTVKIESERTSPYWTSASL